MKPGEVERRAECTFMINAESRGGGSEEFPFDGLTHHQSSEDTQPFASKTRRGKVLPREETQLPNRIINYLFDCE